MLELPGGTLTIMPGVIPEELQNWRFILIAPKTKIPTSEMSGWADDRETKTLKFNDPKLFEHIKKGGNYGVLTDIDRFVVATDTKETEKAIEDRLPKTFTVRSPRHKTKHFYFYGKLTKPIQCKPSTQGDPVTDIKFGNGYAMGPGSTFQNYGKYEIVDNIPVATITEPQLLAAIDEFIIRRKPKRNKETREYIRKNPALSFPITKILNLENYTKNDSHIWGSHPIHGSETGANFHVDTEKNVWYCFRHNNGGGPLELLAVLEKIVDCDDIHKGLKGDKLRQTITKAQEKALIENFNFTEEKGIEEADIETILQKIEEKGFIFKTPTDIEEPYYFDNGIYKKAEHKIKATIEAMLGSKASNYIINEVLGHIKRSSYVERSEFNKYDNVIPVLNGLLNLKTLELEEFDPNRIFTYKLNVSYYPEKKCPTFEDFLTKVLSSEDIPLMQEWLGYHLLPRMPKHKIMWFYGGGRNGKGRITATIEAILGKNNCSYLELQEFNGNRRFSLYGLYGKLANIASEPSTTASLQTPLLKKISGEDTLDAEVKNKQNRVTFQNIAKVTVLGNRFPRVEDTTTAFWDRVLLINFPNTFTGKDQIDNIERTWLDNPDEVSGILNFILEGLHRLGSHGFTKSNTTEETILHFKRASDPIIAWLQEEIEEKTDAYIKKQEAYENYKKYVNEIIGTSPVSNREFYQRLRTQPKIKEAETKINNKTERIFKGIKLKNTADTTDTTGEDNSKKNRLLTDFFNKKIDGVVSAVSAVNPQEVKEENKETEEKPLEVTIRFKKVNSRVESHGCDNPECENGKAILSEFKQLLDVETAKELGRDALYFCPYCFKNAKANAEKDGVKFVEVPMDEPTDDQEEGL